LRSVSRALGDLQVDEMKCLIDRDLSSYDYISVGKDGFIPVNVKLMIVTRLENVSVCDSK
jgi:hypothetical protein